MTGMVQFYTVKTGAPLGSVGVDDAGGLVYTSTTVKRIVQTLQRSAKLTTAQAVAYYRSGWSNGAIASTATVPPVTKGHPHPGQRYTHGWKPVTPGSALQQAAQQLGDLGTERPRTLPVGAPHIRDGDPPLTEYVPGRWHIEAWDRDAEIDKQVNGFLDTIKSMQAPTPDAEKMQQIREHFDRQIPQTNAYITVRNGPHQIIAHQDDLTPENAARLADRADALQAIAPLKRIRIRVHDGDYVGDTEEERQNVLGQTERGTGNIALRPRAFDAWRIHPALRDDRHHMPIAQTVDQLTYVLAHEWGHAVDAWDNGQRIQMWGQGMNAGPSGLGDMSGYGELSPAESLAEAFAEWVLSGGETANHTTQTYAGYFHEAWGWRWAT